MKATIHKARIALIRLAKVLPFTLCFLVFISYAENVYALYTESFAEFNGCYILSKPISWTIAKLFVYDFKVVIIAALLSISFETCIYNKMALLYLLFQIWLKSYFQTHEWANYELYYVVSAINIVICLFFVVKGIQILTKH